MKMTIHYTADADTIGNLIADLPDTELRKLQDEVELLPELFPALTIEMVHTEARQRFPEED